jgi:Beta-galactosidase/FG-GAP-like repeat
MNDLNKKKPHRLRLSEMSFLLGALFCALLMMTEKAFSEVPRGVFCLLPSGQGNGRDPLVYSDPDVDGVSVRQDWSDLEPSEGLYDWRFLDNVTARAGAAGKAVLLRIGTGGGDIALGGSCPTWVMDAVAAEPLPTSQKFYTFNDGERSVTIAVFWDPVWLAKKTAMITALGARYSSNPAVKIVGASFANATTEDWNVPHAPPQVAAWFAAGYTSARMLDAGRQIIDATMAAFPSQYVTLAVGSNGPTLDPDPSYVARNAVLNARAAWPSRLIVQKNSLATFIPAAPGTGTRWDLLWNSRPDVAGQMLWWCYGDTSYRVNGGVPINPSTALINSVNKGAAYGMKYIEIYRSDIINLPGATHYAHTALRPVESVGRAAVSDFNGDGHPDYVLYAAGTRQTAIWYLNNNLLTGGHVGPTVPNNWNLAAAADFDRDDHTDYALFYPSRGYTAIWYMSGPTFLGGAWGPTAPGSWELVATADFNGDDKPDYVLYNGITRQTAIWYLDNNVLMGGDVGPTIPNGWMLAGVADFDRDGHPDYALFHPNTGITAVWYLSGSTLVSGAWGPTVPIGWVLVATADFNGDSNPDYVLYKPTTRQTAIWYLNNNIYVSGAYGPALPAGWSLIER